MLQYCIMGHHSGLPDGRIADVLDIRTPYDKKDKEKTAYKPKDVLLPKRTQKPDIGSNYVEYHSD